MVGTKNSNISSRASSALAPLSAPVLSLSWDVTPLSLLPPQHQIQIGYQAQEHEYSMGQKIWSTVGCQGQYLILSGKVRLRDVDTGQSVAVLTTGQWFGDLLDLSGNYSAIAANQVVVAQWSSTVWREVSTAEIEQFWQTVKQTLQPFKDKEYEPIGGFPFIASPNTAAACLTMAAQQLGASIQLTFACRHIKSGRQSARRLVATAETLGLQLRRLQLSWKDLHQTQYPALLHWQQKTWVLLYGVRGNRAIVANPLNPESTCLWVPKTHLEAAWDGQLWSVEPSKQQETFNLKWFLPAIWRYRRLLWEVMFASLILQILGLGNPILTQVIIDKAMVQSSTSTLDVMLIALLCVAVFETLLGILRLFLFTHTARRLDLGLSSQVFRHLMQLPLAYFEARRVGDTVARIREMENIRQFLTGTALTVILDAVFVVVYLAIMLFYSPLLTGVAVAVIPFFSILMLVSTPILRSWLDQSFNRSADAQSFLVETVTGIHAVKAHGAERTARERWEGLFARYVRTDFRASTISNISGNLGTFLTSLSYLLILGVGAHLVMQHQMTVGQLVAFQMLSNRVISPILRLVQLWQDFQQVLLSVTRLGDILNVTPEVEAGVGLPLPQLTGEVTFDRVFFRYRPEQEPILRGVSFTAKPGTLVGIVGRSGSGKSTLSKLLQGLYRPESGRILVDGIDIKSADLTSLREQISVVLQDDFLFNSSVLENITLGNPDISVDEVVQAAQGAAAHPFVSDLAYGYSTNVGERGNALSGGQRQRIALARLFLSKAPILVLDEATSALDSETEQLLIRNLKAVAQNRTTFMITHRFEPLKQADQILVLDKGILVEQGNHQELMESHGVYWSLYKRQHTPT